METNVIYNEDCLQGMQRMPDKSVDLIITDPPYLIQTRGAGFHKKRDYFDVLEEKQLMGGVGHECLEQMARVMKKTNIYIFCNKNLLGLYFDFFKDKYCDVLVWHKTNPIPVVNNKYLSDIEYIFYAREKGVKIHGEYSTLSKVYTSLVNKKDLKTWGHPTIKPLGLVQRFVYNSSAPGDIILDPFLGSGTTAIAAMQQGREYIGFEKSKDYYETACKRIDLERRQLRLTFNNTPS